MNQFDRIISMLKRSELALPLGVMFIVALLFIPLPAAILDIMFSISIAIAILVMLNVLMTEKAMDFSSFPTILLVTTLMRLALNVASTRLILTNGHASTDAAGQIIEAFGQIIMSGEFLVGIMIFIIYLVFNFVVITKGATRIAEVAARFSLDSLPGKQMAIDADLNAGLINEEQARDRRTDLEYETSFYGAMDGASKFVRGDAIAGLIITAINIVAGVAAGMTIHDMGFAEAADRYIILTVGDGLVAMVPALIISLSAGFLVSKARHAQASGTLLFKQFAKYPKALYVLAGMMALLGLLPGIPLIPFWLLAMAAGGSGYLISVLAEQEQAEIIAEQQQAEEEEKPSEEPLSSILQIDTLRLQLGYGLLGLIDESKGGRLTEQIKAMRRQLAKEIGFVVPSIRIQDNMQLESGGYSVAIKDVEVAKGNLRPGMLLAMDATGQAPPIEGEETIEPTFGLPARWIQERLREEASFNGYTVVDNSTVIVTHLTEVIKDNLSELLTRQEVQKLLSELPQDQKAVAQELVPDQVSIGLLQKVLQNLLAERVSIRDLLTIIEASADAITVTKNLQHITELVRARLSRQITAAHLGHDGHVQIISLSTGWEKEFTNALVTDGEDRHLAMEPSKVQNFLRTVKDTFEKTMAAGGQPILLTAPSSRPYVRSVLERSMPTIPVLSQQELHPKIKIKTVGTV